MSCSCREGNQQIEQRSQSNSTILQSFVAGSVVLALSFHKKRLLQWFRCINTNSTYELLNSPHRMRGLWLSFRVGRTTADMVIDINHIILNDMLNLSSRHIYSVPYSSAVFLSNKLYDICILSFAFSTLVPDLRCHFVVTVFWSQRFYAVSISFDNRFVDTIENYIIDKEPATYMSIYPTEIKFVKKKT